MNLVTGGAGYIGSHFIKRYLDTHPQEEIVAVDNLSTGHIDALSFSPRVHLVEANIADIKSIEAVLKQYQIKNVIHFAASCYVGESQEKPALYFENNCMGTLRLLEAMQNCGVKRMVFSSTCATYGNPDFVSPSDPRMDETHPQNPINVYGSTKLMIEQALRAYSLAKGWSFVALRYFNACGADESGLIGERHDPETHLIPLILQAALGKRPDIKVYGNDYPTADGTCIRDYIHVNDLATAHIQALDYLQTHQGGEAFNLGTASGASVLEVIECCKAVTGRNIPVTFTDRRPGDPPVLVANADKAYQKLGWKPAYDLRRTIETAWDWEQKQGH
jgi:UDP-glucose 4-epimerase